MVFDLAEKRYVKETGLETRIARIVEPVANDLGYSLVRVKVTQENGCTLQIMAEDRNGRFAITDCERLSKDLSPVLDVEDPIDREYHLEVSSPGIDRPLVRARDYAAHIGHEAKIELGDALEGRKRFRGVIAASTADTVTIHLPDVPRDTDPDFVLPLASIAEAKLVIELDGGQHMDSDHDLERDAWLKQQGWQVLRFWNNEVLQNREGVLTVIAEAIAAPPPQPSPWQGEGA